MHSKRAPADTPRMNVARPLLLASMMAQVFAVPFAHGGEIETSVPDLKIRWDNTVKYSAAFRVKDPSDQFKADPNQDDGTRNFDRGLVSNRLDLLSEFDATYNNFGLRLSGAAWYDTEYTGTNDNDSAPGTGNAFGVAYNRFSAGTRKVNGRDVELLDAFVSARFEPGGTPVTVRVGRHALLWGESMFFGSNGIAAGQAPTDVSKALSVPNLRFNELIRPDNQVSGQVQISPTLALAGYYKLGWEGNRMPGTGSYFAGVATDFVLPGSDMLYIPGAGTAAFLGRARDMEPGDSGQGGLQLKYRPENSDVDFGFYALQYNERGFQVLLKPGYFSAPPIAPNQVGEYQLVYHKHVRTFGLSASTSVGNVNFAGEVSVHRNLGLQSTAQVDLGGTSDNDKNPLYAVGNSVQAQFSWIASLGPSFIAAEASWVGEVAWNRRTSITKNAAALDPNSTRSAWSLRTIYEPSYRQVRPGLDISVPVGLGYSPSGRSSVVGAFSTPRSGDVNVGINGTYLDAWRIGLSYTHYFGSANTFLVPISLANQTYGQGLKDRDYIALSVRRTF
ncbi:DUF1302 family protein [Massilia sp. METH4]|uniref:DUF1302 domain-containing protein n=1 Tax=Massilia sp. METH4 TaxID=3123041 RepID=UPI0030CD8C27